MVGKKPSTSNCPSRKTPGEPALAQRLRRNISPKNLDLTAGLSWREERELNKALYASLQETKKLTIKSELDPDPPLVPSNSIPRRNLLARVLPRRQSPRSSKPVVPIKSNVSMRSPTLPPPSDKRLKSQHSIGGDESSQDSVRSSTTSCSNDDSKGTKVRAQRKFAQMHAYGNTMVPSQHTPVKQSSKTSSPIKVFPKRAKTEDFLTFLCLRGTQALPPHLDFFNFSRDEGDTSLPPTPPNRGRVFVRESSPSSSSTSCSNVPDEVADSPAPLVMPPSGRVTPSRKAARACAGTPETARGFASFPSRQGQRSQATSKRRQGYTSPAITPAKLTRSYRNGTPSPVKGTRGKASPGKMTDAERLSIKRKAIATLTSSKISPDKKSRRKSLFVDQSEMDEKPGRQRQTKVTSVSDTSSVVTDTNSCGQEARDGDGVSTSCNVVDVNLSDVCSPSVADVVYACTTTSIAKSTPACCTTSSATACLDDDNDKLSKLDSSGMTLPTGLNSSNIHTPSVSTITHSLASEDVIPCSTQTPLISVQENITSPPKTSMVPIEVAISFPAKTPLVSSEDVIPCPTETSLVSSGEVIPCPPETPLVSSEEVIPRPSETPLVPSDEVIPCPPETPLVSSDEVIPCLPETPLVPSGEVIPCLPETPLVPSDEVIPCPPETPLVPSEEVIPCLPETPLISSGEVVPCPPETPLFLSEEAIPSLPETPLVSSDEVISCPPETPLVSSEDVISCPPETPLVSSDEVIPCPPENPLVSLEDVIPSPTKTLYAPAKIVGPPPTLHTNPNQDVISCPSQTKPLSSGDVIPCPTQTPPVSAKTNNASAADFISCSTQSYPVYIEDSIHCPSLTHPLFAKDVIPHPTESHSLSTQDVISSPTQSPPFFTDDAIPCPILTNPLSMENVYPSQTLTHAFSTEDVNPSPTLTNPLSMEDSNPSPTLTHAFSTEDVNPSPTLTNPLSMENVNPSPTLTHAFSTEDVNPSPTLTYALSTEDVTPCPTHFPPFPTVDVIPCPTLNNPLSTEDVIPCSTLTHPMSTQEVNPCPTKSPFSTEDAIPCPTQSNTLSTEDVNARLTPKGPSIYTEEIMSNSSKTKTLDSGDSLLRPFPASVPLSSKFGPLIKGRFNPESVRSECQSRYLDIEVRKNTGHDIPYPCQSQPVFMNTLNSQAGETILESESENSMHLNLSPCFEISSHNILHSEMTFDDTDKSSQTEKNIVPSLSDIALPGLGDNSPHGDQIKKVVTLPQPILKTTTPVSVGCVVNIDDSGFIDSCLDSPVLTSPFPKSLPRHKGILAKYKNKTSTPYSKSKSRKETFVSFLLPPMSAPSKIQAKTPPRSLVKASGTSKIMRIDPPTSNVIAPPACHIIASPISDFTGPPISEPPFSGNSVVHARVDNCPIRASASILPHPAPPYSVLTSIRRQKLAMKSLDAVSVLSSANETHPDDGLHTSVRTLFPPPPTLGYRGMPQ